jgi:hypothetical protein
MMAAPLLEGFDPAEIAAAMAGRAAEVRRLGASAAIRRAHRAYTRRATSADKLAQLLPPQIQPGESWHVLSSGDIDVLAFIRHLLAGARWFDFVLSTTWRINRDDLEQVEAWLNAGAIEEFHLLIDQRFGRLAPDEYQLAQHLAATYGGSVTTCLNHSKVTLCGQHASNTWLVIESSANINTNNRLEQTAVHNCQTLFEFYKEAFNGIRQRRATA